MGNRFYMLFTFDDFTCWVPVSENAFNRSLDYFQKHLHKNASVDLFDDYVFEYCLGDDVFGYVVKEEGVNI